MGQLCIRNKYIRELAMAVMKATGDNNKTEVVRQSQRARETVPLREGMRKLQEAVTAKRGPTPKPIDLKNISDEVCNM
jgi:hypothetical protein